jgi:hypothetical protein
LDAEPAAADSLGALLDGVVIWKIAGQGTESVGVDTSRADAGDVDAVLSDLGCQTTGQAEHRGLGRLVRVCPRLGNFLPMLEILMILSPGGLIRS